MLPGNSIGMLGFLAYQVDVARFVGTGQSIEDGANHSQHRVFHEVGKLLFGKRSDEALAYAHSQMAQRVHRGQFPDPQLRLDLKKENPSAGNGRGCVLTVKALGNLQERMAFLNCRRLPARLNSAETALLLGVQEHDIAALTAAKLLDALGKPAPNGPKYFAAVDVLARADNAEWLSQATRTLARF